MQNNGSFSIDLGLQGDDSFLQLNNSYQYLLNLIQKIALSSEHKIDKDLFEKINKKKGQLLNKINNNKGQLYIDLQKILTEDNYCTRFIKKQGNCSQLLAKSWEVYQRQKDINILKNGSYYFYGKQIVIMFSQSHITCLTTVNNQIYGFKYKYRNKQIQNKPQPSRIDQSQPAEQQNNSQRDNKQVYCGHFVIKQKQIVCSGHGKLLIKQKNCWSVYSGIWMEDQIKEKEKGQKHCYWDQNLKSLKQHWVGQFKNMKYHGKGTISEFDNNGKPKKKGELQQYQYGNYIRKVNSP